MNEMEPTTNHKHTRYIKRNNTKKQLLLHGTKIKPTFNEMSQLHKTFDSCASPYLKVTP